MHKKPFLPSKPCAHCGRPFNWRKKWHCMWPAVKYCSQRCSRQARQMRGGGGQ